MGSLTPVKKELPLLISNIVLFDENENYLGHSVDGKNIEWEVENHSEEEESFDFCGKFLIELPSGDTLVEKWFKRV